jgi:hypothetical protein
VSKEPVRITFVIMGGFNQAHAQYVSNVRGSI